MIEHRFDASGERGDVERAVKFDDFGRQVARIVGIDLLRDPDSVLRGGRAYRSFHRSFFELHEWRYRE
ncbi:hypothetical protein BLA6863_06677 [Burkholderia lata]|uniref:Uncharacterized protein n=1 Tax=Burkholderia lata (strain ATCC 17760 / DSM 23089 / LMG 22485 / NCIMB 9086 / R18194 / 383) TaxID=482957 RepID=A0A6P2RZT2_BURL3|nr:hypothetical protein BLA6863_06677 [Burkholderia lata]